MPGHIIQPLHRRCLESNTTVVSSANTNAAIDALDDKKHSSQDIFLNASASKNGYKDAYKSILTVTPNSSFGDLANNQNIKKIVVTVKDGKDAKTLVQLQSYSFNIGEADFYKKAY